MTVPNTPTTSNAAPSSPAALPTTLQPPRKYGIGFWMIAGAFLTAMAFNAVPTPLYPLYQAQDGFGTLMVTVVFSVFAAGVGVGLVLLGHISDWVGRKKILIPALILEALSAAVFLAFPELPGLLIGRLIGGVGIGMISATATAYLKDLHTVRRHDAGSGLFEIVSTGANVGGLALGPLIAGALAQYVGAPLRVPYIVFGILLLLALVAVACTPETVTELLSRPTYRPQRISADHGDRSGFIAAAASGFVAFAVNGVYTSLSAGFVAGTLHRSSVLLAGTVAFALFAAATLSQLLAGRLPLRTQQALGIGGEAVGLVLLMVGIQSANLAIFLIAGVVCGAGVGVSIKYAIGMVAAMAAPAKRGEALAGLFLVCYAGMSVPTVGVGIAAHFIPLTGAMYGFCGTLFLVLAAVAVLVRRVP
ncbi:MFS transporter [Rhodococcus koreensis]|uniref:MFS transporter n=1 Tax=Rhodococcus koreensis TaxID=99653 RepID=UPI00198122AD|nr:MFS transporter [Rhodococcus koreensis]QSE86654.1 MFS transporter [Rhodococcus koreensis]